MGPVKRPLLLRLSSGRARSSIFYRFYSGRAVKEKWRGLFQNATLTFPPGVEISLLASDLMHTQIAFTGEYERPLSRFVVELGATGGTLVDVGANIGYFSLLWAARHPANVAHAFEASPRNIPLLKQNVYHNNLGGRIVIHDYALGRETGSANFDLGPEGLSGWGGLSLDTRGANLVQVPVKRLDDAIGDVHVDLLKIDAEGADTWVLMGASELLRTKRIKRVWYEQNRVRMEKHGIRNDAAQSFLRSVGYATRPISDISQCTADWMAVPLETSTSR
jgi:FkbM family methyltransferase